ncbi:MAG: AMP-binding protein [Ilumatobacteraceae bacterium]|nr:AMP-binding protein [Ilumatobacteraceae bacterium]
MGAATIVELFGRSRSTLHFEDGTHRTARDLLADGRQIAARLSEAGVRRGDRLALHLPNGPEYVRRLLACAVGGFVAVSVNTRYSDDEVDSLVERSGAIDVAWPEDRPAARPDPSTGHADDPFVVFTTSGTTSRPKMVIHAQRSIAVHAGDAATGFGYTVADVVMVAMPLCGTFGLTSLTAAVAADATIVLSDFELRRTADLIGRHRVTAINGSDDMFHRLIAHGTPMGTIDLGGYARFNSSLDRVVADAESVGARLTGLYGMSEVQALFSVRDLAADSFDRARPGGTLVSPAAAYRLVDDELQVRGPSLMVGYLAEGGAEVDGELTAAHFDDGWFRTGDLARADDERTFEYLTRRGDAMRLGGFLVDPTEVEAVITEVAGVAAAQVVAVDRPGGARPVAFVIGTFDEAEVIARCRDRMARFKVPIRVIGIDAFPAIPGANGTKIQRGKLRELATSLLTDEV